MARGLKTNDGTKKTYVSFSNGVFVKRVTEAGKETITRNLAKGPDAGKEIHELHFTTIEGQVISIEKHSHEDYGDSWAFTVDISLNEESPEELVLKMGAGYAKSLLMKTPNIDFSKDVVLRAYSFTPQGETKERKGVAVAQGGQKVAPAYTKEERNGLPEMKQTEFKGKTQWDDYDQLVYLEAMVNKDIKPKLKGTIGSEPEPKPEPATNAENEKAFDAEGTEAGDELPF